MTEITNKNSGVSQSKKRKHSTIDVELEDLDDEKSELQKILKDLFYDGGVSEEDILKIVFKSKLTKRFKIDLEETISNLAVFISRVNGIVRSKQITKDNAQKQLLSE
ncbi:21800_t:CDS:1, partial [Racocetra persica]